MRYELNFDEDKVNDVLVVGGASYDLKGCCDIMNEQQDQISYWKHKVNSLLWILGQFDEEKVKGLLKEMTNE